MPSFGHLGTVGATADYHFEPMADWESITRERDTTSVRSAADAATLSLSRTTTSVTGATEDTMRKEFEALMRKAADSTGTMESREKAKGDMERLMGRLKKIVSTKETERLAARTATKTLERKVRATEVRLREIRNVLKVLRGAQVVDLLFVVDSTASMQSYIDGVKNQIGDMVTKLREASAHLRLNVGFLGYRDIGDATPFVTLEFTEDLSKFRGFLGSVRAMGGGDTCEDIAGALEHATRFCWSSPTRVLLHVADAPCHGRRYHNGCYDNYPGGDPKGRDMTSLVRALCGLDAAINTSTDRMIDVLHSDLGNPYIKSTRMSDASKITETVVASVTTSISASADKTMRTMAPKGTLPATMLGSYTVEEKIAVVKDRPDWSVVRVVQGYMYVHDKIESIDDLLKDLHVRKSPTPESLKIAPVPFATGGTRMAHYAQYYNAKKAKWVDVVLKQFKSREGHIDKSRDDYLAQIDTHAVAVFLAGKFNLEKRSNAALAGCRDIKYIPSHVVEVHASGCTRYYTMETLLDHTAYKRFSNNDGGWSHWDVSVGRFSMWTHDVTGGNIMVADLQGVDMGAYLQLTDPVILSKDVLRFGTTNLGPDAMRACVDAIKRRLA